MAKPESEREEAQCLAENSQPASLVIFEKGSLSPKLLFQNAVLLVKVLDDSLLRAIQPTRERDQIELAR